MVTKLRHRDTTLLRTRYAVSTVGNAMQCHVIILNRTGTSYTFYEIEKTKEYKENQNKSKEKRKT